MILFSALYFGSLPMLGWLAAALLPWLIHRLARRRYRTTPWAAAELLLAAVKQRASRVYFQQWLLLAVRTLIVALVALAVAEPVWQAWGIDLSGTSSGHLVVVIDQSYSMSGRVDDRSRLDRAKQHARQMIDRSRYEVYSVIGWGEDAENVMGRPTAEASLAREAIQGLQERHSIADFAEAEKAVLAAVGRVEQEWPHVDQHRVVFFSDLTQTTWAPQAIDPEMLTALAERVSLELVDVGDQQRDNLAIVDLSVDSDVILREQEVVFTATLHGFGTQAWNDVSVELKVDGQLVETKTVALPAGREVSATFATQFVGEGRHTVQVSVVGSGDALSIDDRRWLVVEVRPKLRIACVAGNLNAADDVARALMPHAVSGDDRNKIQADLVAMGRLDETDFFQYDVVILCNATGFTSKEQARLATYVRSGGGLAVLTGEQTLVTGELANLLPVEIGAAVSRGDYRFDLIEDFHPILEPFRGQAQSGLSQVAIAKYRELLPRAGCESAEIVLALDTGDPALVVDEVGAGRVAVLAIPASLAANDAEGLPWSNFPVSPSFLPVVRELVAYLASDPLRGQQNLLVGQPAVCKWDRSRQLVPIEVRGPGDRQLTLPALGAEDGGQVVLADTSASGIYALSAGGDEFAWVAVNLDIRESDLTVVQRDLLPEVLTEKSSRSGQMRSAVGGGRSFVRSLLAVAILLLLLENALACWQGRAWQ